MLYGTVAVNVTSVILL